MKKPILKNNKYSYLEYMEKIKFSWLLIHPLFWNKSHIKKWIEFEFKRIISVKDRKKLCRKFLSGKFLCEEDHLYFFQIDDKNGLDIFEKLHTTLASFDFEYIERLNIGLFLKHCLEFRKELICWIDENERFFRIIDPEGLAKLWGKTPNNERMNFNKMCRTIRHRYGKDIISKGNYLLYCFKK